MKQQVKKLHTKAKKAAQSPAGRRALTSLKPSKTIWGFLGVVLFFIVPEVVAFIWGEAIAAYAREQLPLASSTALSYYYEGLAMLFENGGSWINLLIGAAMLVWLFF
jgi:uncharacterized membrane protein